jgi:hypothetical protein
VIVARVIWLVLRGLALAIHAVVSSVIGGIYWIISNGLIPAIEALGKWAGRIGGWIQTKLSPITRFLTKVKGWLDWAWKNIVSPILLSLDLAHLVLSGLGQLGVKWAQRLDEKVYVIRSWIYRVWRETAGKLNDALSILSLFADPRGWLRRSPALWSVWLYGHEMLGLIVQIHGRPVTFIGAGPGARLQLDDAIEDFRTGKLADSSGMLDGLEAFDELTSNLRK